MHVLEFISCSMFDLLLVVLFFIFCHFCSCYFLFFFFFFFFQAEDGIRDIGVTGVQTCALPIFREVFSGVPMKTSRMGFGWFFGVAFLARSWFSAVTRVFDSGEMPKATGRSEERRVGKEGRAGWVGRREGRRRNEGAEKRYRSES